MGESPAVLQKNRFPRAHGSSVLAAPPSGGVAPYVGPDPDAAGAPQPAATVWHMY